jgi:hypothetical protein
MEVRTTDNLSKHLLIRASHSDGDVKYYEFWTGVLWPWGEIAHLGEYRFKRGGHWDDGSQVTTDGLREITAPKLPGLAKDTWQRVEIIAVGNEFRLRVDDREVSAFQDTESRLKQGQVAFRLPIGCHVEIRNIEIKELNGKGLKSDKVPGAVPSTTSPTSPTIPATVEGIREGVLLSTGEMDSPSQWLYTTVDPGAEWASPKFDTRQWTLGLPTFGQSDPPHIPFRTRWETPAIWLRTSVVVPRLSPNHILILRLWNDDGVEIYVNGELLIQRHYVVVSRFYYTNISLVRRMT